VCRSVTSVVSAISSFVAKGHQTMHYVSSSLSKIPYGGFSPVRLQTGIQPQPSLVRCGLSARPTFTRSLTTYMGLKSLTQNRAHRFRRRAKAQAVLPSLSEDNPVQRPLAPQRVMLSPRLVAYYGLIRNSQPLPSTYDLYDGSLPYGLVWAGIERLPNLLHMSLSSVPSYVPRRAKRLHSTVPSPSVLAFATFAQARHPQSHTRRFSHRSCNEAARFALCYGPEESLALPRQGRLLSSFHLVESPRPDVEYNYAGKQSIPAAGLTPARHAALWAANEEHEAHEVSSSCSSCPSWFD
jgi:hypothetical protein